MILEIEAPNLVVVSDLHLGCPASKAANHISRFLDDVVRSGRALCINGDGFDLLQSSSVGLAIQTFPVLRQLREMSDAGTAVHYVLGNHDLALEHVLFDLGFTVAPFLNLRSGDSLIRIEHGHVYDPFYARHPSAYEFGGRVGRLALLAHADTYALWARAQRRIDNRRRRPDNVRAYPHHEAADDLFRRGFDAVILGHTHRPEFTDLGDGTFVNCGDWLHRRSFVTIDEGAIDLHEWEPDVMPGVRSRRGSRPRRSGRRADGSSRRRWWRSDP